MILQSRELKFNYKNLMFIHMKSRFDFWKDYCDFFIDLHNSEYYNPSVLIPFDLNILDAESLNFIIQYCRKNLCNIFSIDFIEMNFTNNHITKNIKKILNYYIYKDSSFHMDTNDRKFLQVVNDYSNYEDFIESLVKNPKINKKLIKQMRFETFDQFVELLDTDFQELEKEFHSQKNIHYSFLLFSYPFNYLIYLLSNKDKFDEQKIIDLFEIQFRLEEPITLVNFTKIFKELQYNTGFLFNKIYNLVYMYIDHNQKMSYSYLAQILELEKDDFHNLANTLFSNNNFQRIIKNELNLSIINEAIQYNLSISSLKLLKKYKYNNYIKLDFFFSFLENHDSKEKFEHKFELFRDNIHNIEAFRRKAKWHSLLDHVNNY